MRLGRPLFGDRKIRQHGDPSGLAVAERAHQRGKASPALESGLFDVRVGFTAYGDRANAETIADTITAVVVMRDDISRVSVSVTER